MSIDSKLELNLEGIEKFVEIPQNSYLAFAQDLGTAELCALVAGSILTGFADNGLDILSAGRIPEPLKDSILMWVQPIVEKPFLFIPYILKTIKEQREQKNLETIADSIVDIVQNPRLYLSETWKKGKRTLRADIMGHDPYYMAFFWTLATLTDAETAVAKGACVVAAFFAAATLATIGEVKLTDFIYGRLGKKLERADFKSDEYFETRYLIDPEGGFTPEKVLDEISSRFDLTQNKNLTFRDIYAAKHSLIEYNSRRPYVRFRRYLNEDGEQISQSVQVVYTRAMKIVSSDLDMHRCFPLRKHKFKLEYASNDEFPSRIEDIPDKQTRRLLNKARSDSEYFEITFSRRYHRDPAGLLVSTDVFSGGPFWIEVNVRTDIPLLMDANQYIMERFHPKRTTLGKYDLSKAFS